MGLKEAIQNATVAAFSALGNISEAVTYRVKPAAPTYNTTTGVVAVSKTDYAVSMVFSRFESKEVNGGTVLATDEIGSIPTLNLSVTPTVNDEIIRSGSEIWRVMGFKTDSARAKWSIHVRRAG